MNEHFFRPKPGVRRLAAPCVAALVGLLPLFAADELVPAPAQAFTPQAALLFYMDDAAASQAPVYKALEEKTASLSGQLSSLPGMPVALPSEIPSLDSLKADDLTELAVVVEGSALVNSIESGKVDPSTSFLVVGRLKRTVDSEALLAELLGTLEKELPGTSNQIASTRSRVGAADVFKLPLEALGIPDLPFAVSFAVGPGQGGTILLAGRTERVQDFLAGKTSGQVPPRLNAVLPRRGQYWLYVPVPDEARKKLSATPNPALTPIVDQVRELGVNFEFGATAVEVQFALSFAEAGAAGQMAETVKGGLAAAAQFLPLQGPGANPAGAFLQKLNATAEGQRFVLRLSLTPEDVEKALQGIPGFTPAPAAAAKPAPKVEAPPEPAGPPVEIEFLGLVPTETQDLRRGKLRIQNLSSKSVREIRLTYSYFDRAGRRLGEWTRRQQDSYKETLIGPSTSRQMEVNLFEVPLRTEQVKLVIDEVTFTDGERWEAKQ